MALQTTRYKLVGDTGYEANLDDLSLYDLNADPSESSNIMASNRNFATTLKADLDELYLDLVSSENMTNPPRIVVGSSKENPVILNRNDAGGERGIWAQEEIYGQWSVHILPGKYNITFKFITPVPSNGTLYLETSPFVNQRKIATGPTDVLEMRNVYLPAMDCDLVPFYVVAQRRIFPFYVSIEKVN
jgi:arylsulfatase